MSDGLNDHVGSLIANNPADTGKVEPTGDGSLFDQGDQLLEEPLEVNDDLPGLDDDMDHGAPDMGTTVPESSTDDGDGENDLDALRTELERVKAESSGRLNDLASLREERRQFSENLEEMRKMFVEQSKAAAEAERQRKVEEELETEAQLYGEDVVSDPQTRYIRDIIAQNRQQMEEYQQQQEHYRQRLNEQREQFLVEQNYNQQMLGTLKSQEESYAKDHEDYYDAYDYARGKRVDMWKRRGYSPQDAEAFVAQEEKQLLVEQLPRGGNVAEHIYQLAKDWGWSGKVSDSNQDQNRQQSKSRNSVADIDRIKAGLSSQGSGQMRSAGGGGKGAREMTREEFFNTVPPEKRTQLFMDRPEVFEALGRHGRVTVDWD